MKYLLAFLFLFLAVGFVEARPLTQRNRGTIRNRVGAVRVFTPRIVNRRFIGARFFGARVLTPVVDSCNGGDDVVVAQPAVRVRFIR